MGKISYAENRKKHLKTYAKERELTVDGKWQGKGSYSHILQFKENIKNVQNRKNKHKVVCEKNILPGILTDKFTWKDMHKYAHHLNSSQVLCYNFFRPLITEESHPTDELIRLLEKIEIKILSSAICEFEYCPDKKEKTQFDFHIKDGDIEVFFEIKYTEQGFGKAKKDDSHEEKFTTIYKKYLAKQKCLKWVPTFKDENLKEEFEEFANHYQLYRNAIRVTDEKKHVVLLYPESNTEAEKEARRFIEEKIKEEYKKNVLCLHWEDIVKEESELYRKYFAE